MNSGVLGSTSKWIHTKLLCSVLLLFLPATLLQIIDIVFTVFPQKLCLVLRELSVSSDYILQKILKHVGHFSGWPLWGFECESRFGWHRCQGKQRGDIINEASLPTFLLPLCGSTSQVLWEDNYYLMFISLETESYIPGMENIVFMFPIYLIV